MKKKMYSLKILFILFITLQCMFFATTVNAAPENNTTGEFINDEYIETTLNIESVEINNSEKSREISLPITVKNAQALCGGTLSIEYSSDLVFNSIENENKEYTFRAVNNPDMNKLVITFSGEEAYNGDVNLLNVRFNLPETLQENTYYLLNFADETTLLTSNTITNSYTLNDGQIYVKGQNNGFNIKLILIAAAIVIILILVVLIIKKQKNKR